MVSGEAVVVRPLTPDDIPVARQLLAQLTGRMLSAEDLQNRLDFVASSAVDWFYAGECDGQVCGLLALRLRERLEVVGRYMEVYLIVIDRAVRRQGIGRALMAFAEQQASARRCGGMFLVSGFSRQDEAHRFYEQLGYVATGYRFVTLLDY